MTKAVNPPKGSEVRSLRLKFDLLQREAADMVHVKIRAWQNYEQGDADGYSPIPIQVWELFQLKCQYGIDMPS